MCPLVNIQIKNEIILNISVWRVSFVMLWSSHYQKANEVRSAKKKEEQTNILFYMGVTFYTDNLPK